MGNNIKAGFRKEFFTILVIIFLIYMTLEVNVLKSQSVLKVNRQALDYLILIPLISFIFIMDFIEPLITKEIVLSKLNLKSKIFFLLKFILFVFSATFSLLYLKFNSMPFIIICITSFVFYKLVDFIKTTKTTT